MAKIGDGSKAAADGDEDSKLVVPQVKEAGVTLRYLILAEMHVDEERVNKTRVQTLKRKLDGMYMGDSEKISDFALKITTIVNEVHTLGTKVEEIMVVEKLLHSVPDKFGPLISIIEQWGNVEEMSVMEMIGRLRAFEESSKEAA